MAKLYEFQGKELLKKTGIAIPPGKQVSTADEAAAAAKELGGSVVLKAQAWVTGRAGAGGVKFADSPEDASRTAESMLGMDLKGFRVQTLLVEKKLEIAQEYYAGIIVDDSARKQCLIFSSKGGTGIEEIAEKHPESVFKHHIDLEEGLPPYVVRNLVRKTGIHGLDLRNISDVLCRLYKVSNKSEARSIEINPLVKLSDGKICAADCHAVIDDYAVFRHPDLGIEIAREFDRPPTELEKIAYKVESEDFRGTFFFIQMNTTFKGGEKFVGFHGAGGGGSMMSMDALTNAGYEIANFCDTSGNPPASKVYRAAKIIMAQGPIDGYFGSGSGVASQEQFHSARGLLKAFNESGIRIPVVIRLGGNYEERAIEILTTYRRNFDVPIECYGKDTPASKCAEVLDGYIKKSKTPDVPVENPGVVKEENSGDYTFDTVTGGTVSFDYGKCKGCESKVCASECASSILEIRDGVPVLNITKEEARKGKCSECLACEVECRYKNGNDGCRIHLPVPGLNECLEGR